MREILLGTGNAGKAREMREILGAAAGMEGIGFRTLDEPAFRDLPEPIEDGDTFRANAELKARHYARLTGLWTIADDSGLEVDALGGAPGVHSARFAGTPRSDAANNALLVERLQGIPPAKRTARYHCVVVLCDGERILAEADGTVEGEIIDAPRGSNGFGYDPHFHIASAGKTAAEMEPDEKHALSHRGQALRALQARLGGLVGNGSM